MESSIQVVRIGSTPTIPNGIVAPPQVVSSTYPAYTDEARNRRIEGVVTIEAAFDPAGNPTVVRIVKGLGYGLDENAAAILKDWRFLPATRNGDRIAVIAQVDVQFNLQNDWFRVGIRQSVLYSRQAIGRLDAKPRATRGARTCGIRSIGADPRLQHRVRQ